MKTKVGILCLLTAFACTAHAAAPAFLWDGQGADLFSDDDGPFTIGFQFRSSTAIEVTALGAYDHLGNGFIDEHTVAIWAAGNTTPLVTATIPAGQASTLVGAFRYVDIASLTLTPDTDYIVAASGFHGSANDLYAGSVPNTGFSMGPGLSFEGSRGAAEAPGLNYPTGFREPLSPTTVGANFQFVTIPEPAGWTLLLLGGSFFVLARRHSAPHRAAVVPNVTDVGHLQP